MYCMSDQTIVWELRKRSIFSSICLVANPESVFDSRYAAMVPEADSKLRMQISNFHIHRHSPTAIA